VYGVAFPADTKELVGSPDRSLFSSKRHKIGIPADDFQLLRIFTKADPGVAADVKGRGCFSFVLKPVNAFHGIGAIILQGIITKDLHVLCVL